LNPGAQRWAVDLECGAFSDGSTALVRSATPALTSDYHQLLINLDLRKSFTFYPVQKQGAGWL